MNVLVIGAAGKSGQLVVAEAVAAGHTVTALVHGADDTYHAPAGVHVVEGDATSAATMRRVVAGQHAVVDAVGGHTPYLETHLEENTAKAVVAAMRERGVRRLVVISVLGAGDSRAQATFLYEHLLMPTFLRGAVPDKEAMEAEVQHSGLDFVLVRPPVLSDDPATGSVHVVTGEDKAHSLTRADLAQFIVAQLSSDEHLGQAVVVANE